MRPPSQYAHIPNAPGRLAARAGLRQTPGGSTPSTAEACFMTLPPCALRVLVVDDYPDTAESLSTLLRTDGHEVRTALDGGNALRIARDWPPDVVLLDLGLPGLSGWALAHRLRAP